MERFMSYSWPGNVRELESCIRRAVLLSTGELIAEENLVMMEKQPEGFSHEPGQESLPENFKERLEELITGILEISKNNTHARVIDLVEETLIKNCNN